jgi:sulfur carrier protein ThiS
MPLATIAVTSHLQTVGPAQPQRRQGATVGDVIAALDSDYPLLLNYIFDDQGRVREHVAIFVDGVLRPRGTVLSEPVDESSEVYVFQALSGG